MKQKFHDVMKFPVSLLPMCGLTLWATIKEAHFAFALLELSNGVEVTVNAHCHVFDVFALHIVS